MDWPLFHTRRMAAPLVHLLVSAGVACIAALVVFGIWFPAPYATIAAGTSLFLLLTTVDVILGPVLTAVAADPAKSAKAFRRDVLVIVVLQLAGLAYGMYSISLARPVYLSFEVDRMRVVTAADIETSSLPEAQPEFRSLPWSGPKLIAAVRPTRPDEVLRSIDLALAGIDISMLPSQWRDYASQKDAVLKAAHPIAELEAKYPDARPLLADLSVRVRKPAGELRFLPVLAHKSSTVAVIDASDASVVGFLPFDGFF